MTTYRARILTPDLADPVGRSVRWIDDGVVIVTEGRIDHVGPFAGQDVDHDLRPGVLLPGFVDGHVHFPQTRIIGSASGPLLEWLDKSTFPEESRFADASHAARVAHAFTASLAAAGTTCAFIYSSRHFVAADALFAAMDRRGLRGVAGPVWMDERSPEALTIAPEASADDVAALVERWHGDRLKVAVIPRFAITSSERGLRLAAETAAAHDLWVSTHLAENRAECEAVEELFGAPYLEVYDRTGLLHPKSIYAHCIHLNEAEWNRFAEAGACVAHCPDSNAFLGSGHMPTSALLDRGISMVMGSDIAAGRSFRIPRALSAAYDNALATGYQASPEELLWWGTRDGALAIGHPTIGALAAGLEADMVCLDVPAWAESKEEVLSWILFYTDAPPPRATWVGGHQVWDRERWAAAGGIYPWDDYD